MQQIAISMMTHEAVFVLREELSGKVVIAPIVRHGDGWTRVPPLTQVGPKIEIRERIRFPNLDRLKTINAFSEEHIVPAVRRIAERIGAVSNAVAFDLIPLPENPFGFAAFRATDIPSGIHLNSEGFADGDEFTLSISAAVFSARIQESVAA